MGKEKFDLLETDPPYKLAYTQKLTKGLGTRKIKTKGGFGYKQQRSYLGVEKRGGVPEYNEWLSIANEFQNPNGANIMIFEFWKNVINLWQAMEKYWKIKNMIIWHTPNRHQSFGMKYQFFNKYDISPLAGEGILNEEYEEELNNYLKEKGQKLLDTYQIILSGQKGKSYWNRKKGQRWAKMTDFISWEVVTGKSGEGVIFGTKPIQILVPYIKILSPRNGIVMDPFGGSGSTLIACEIMKRKARIIEICDIYGEVILSRFTKFTGITPIKIN
jgi:DNA modification methylase